LLLSHGLYIRSFLNLFFACAASVFVFSSHAGFVFLNRFRLRSGLFLHLFRLCGERACCRRRVFLLLRQKKVTKEKATPGSLESPKENSPAKAPS
jgi:hypothetical protein